MPAKRYRLGSYPLMKRYKRHVIYRHVRPKGGTYYTIGVSGRKHYLSISAVEAAIDRKEG